MKGKTNTIDSSNVEKASDMSTFFHGKKKTTQQTRNRGNNNILKAIHGKPTKNTILNGERPFLSSQVRNKARMPA